MASFGISHRLTHGGPRCHSFPLHLFTLFLSTVPLGPRHRHHPFCGYLCLRITESSPIPCGRSSPVPCQPYLIVLVSPWRSTTQERSLTDEGEKKCVFIFDDLTAAVPRGHGRSQKDAQIPTFRQFVLLAPLIFCSAPWRSPTN